MRDELILENADKFDRFLRSWKPTRARNAGPSDHQPNPDMIVAARFRPLSAEETELGFFKSIFKRGQDVDPDAAAAGRAIDAHELKQSAKGWGVFRLESASYRADHVYDDSTPTQPIYDDLVAPLLPCAWNGGVATLFAYGQTGSGKTFTISRVEELVARRLFEGGLRGERAVYMSFVEVDGNKTRDLLNSGSAVAVLEDDFGTVQLKGLVEHKITTVDDMLGRIATATALRRTAATTKNDTSSRSHAVCRLRIAVPGLSDPGSFQLVDLAGSEAARDRANHTEDLMREIVSINKSLSVLKDCIRGKAEADLALSATATADAGAKRAAQKPYIPYRQSTLTKILKHIFTPTSDRECKTVVIACVSPCITDVGPSRNTLRFAETLRVLVPPTTELRYDEGVPVTWNNEQVRRWIDKECGSPPISSRDLAPTETGKQVLRLADNTFQLRCMLSEGVTKEHARAFQSKLWQLHAESKRRQPGSAPTGKTGSVPRLSSKDLDGPDPRKVLFKDRIRPGMVVEWTPAEPSVSESKPKPNLAMILCPSKAVAAHVHDITGRRVHEADTSLRRSFLCAEVTPQEFPGSLHVNLWQQVVVYEDTMDKEVLLEFEPNSRYYYRMV